MALVLTFATRNAPQQANMKVDYLQPSIAAPDGQKTVVEWRWRADPGDAWSAPYIDITLALSSTYDPPGDGWVQITVYSINAAGLVSEQGYVHEFPVSGGDLVNPARYVDQDGNPYVDQDGNYYYDA